MKGFIEVRNGNNHKHLMNISSITYLYQDDNGDVTIFTTSTTAPYIRVIETYDQIKKLITAAQ